MHECHAGDDGAACSHAAARYAAGVHRYYAAHTHGLGGKQHNERECCTYEDEHLHSDEHDDRGDNTHDGTA